MGKTNKRLKQQLQRQLERQQKTERLLNDLNDLQGYGNLRGRWANSHINIMFQGRTIGSITPNLCFYFPNRKGTTVFSLEDAWEQCIEQVEQQAEQMPEIYA